jgi:hypothetical protein
MLTNKQGQNVQKTLNFGFLKMFPRILGEGPIDTSRRGRQAAICHAEHRARCSCCSTFRTHPPGVDLRSLYDDKVRQAVLDRDLDDKMSLETVRACGVATRPVQEHAPAKINSATAENRR